MHGGRIEKFIGDAVMAVWGASLAREDDAERAIRTGLRIVTGVARLGRQLQIAELQVRVGVLTGEAAVDMAPVAEGMVIGDAVNTASRIQSLAAPGTVLVDDTTRRICVETIAFRDAGAHAVKGKSEPVRTWEVLGLQPAPVPFGAAAPDLLEPPFVGREDELGVGEQALAVLSAARSRLQLVTVVGDAGLGKSRLTRELERRSQQLERPPRWHRGRAVSFGEGTGLHALAEVIAAAAGIGLGDPPERQRDGLEQLLTAQLPDPEERVRVRPALARLFDLADDGVRLDRGELFSAWRLLLTRMAESVPLVIALDELQVAEQDLLDFISHLREWASDVPILVLGQSRPDERVQTLAASGHTIELRPLSSVQIEQLIAAAVKDPPPELQQTIVADGGGVPLYAVESLRALADQGVLVAEHGRYVVRGELRRAEVPATVRALVAARLDLLDADARRLLVAAAVLGERFSAELAADLAQLTHVSAQVTLAQLTSRLLVARFPDGRHEFVQGVVRRVALANLSRRDRKRLHLAAAELELASPEHEPAVVAGHLLEALDADRDASDRSDLQARAAAALERAAERASGIGSIEETLRTLDRAIELLVDPGHRLDLLERSAMIAARAGLTDEAATRFEAVRRAYADSGRERAALRAAAHRLRAQRYRRAPDELLTELGEIVAALDGIDDAAAALATAILAFTLYQAGEHAAALDTARRAAAIAERAGANGELLHALGTEAIALGELGQLPEALAVYDRVIALAPSHDPARLAELVGNRAMALASLGRFAEAADAARETIVLAEQRGMRFLDRWAHLLLARALCMLGDWDAASTAVETVGRDVAPFVLGMVFGPLVVIALGRGERDRVEELLSDYQSRRVGPVPDDFRGLWTAATAFVDGDPALLARVLPEAPPGAFAEWSGWVVSVVDLLVAGGSPGATVLRCAHAALTRDDEPTKALAPVAAQARRLEAWLAWGDGDRDAAVTAWRAARELAESCGMARAAATIDDELTAAR